MTRPLSSRSLGAALLLSLALGSALTGCGALGGGQPELWETDELSVGSERILWECTVFTLEKDGFPVGTGLDPTTLTATSGWKNSLAPFKAQGWRERAYVRYP